MPTIPITGSLDHLGRLVHEDDAAAQLALSMARVEQAVADAGLDTRALRSLRVLTTAPSQLEAVLDVLTERLEALDLTPEVQVDSVFSLPVPGMVVALQADVATAPGPAPWGPPDPMAPPRLPHQHDPHSEHDTYEGNAMTITTDTQSLTALRGVCPVHAPGDPGYDEARTPWNLAVDQRPAAVAVPRTAEEVAAVVRAAAAAGLRVAPQSTGHGAGPLGETDLSDVVIARLSDLTGVSVDAGTRTARVLGGTLWQDVVTAAAPHGLTALHGSAPDVAVAGYVLSGGLSFYGRRHGVAANSIRAVEVVTADGTIVRADAETHADLFWAIRGGGGNLGVVVAIELELLPYADVHAGMLLWDRERAPEVLRAWARWTQEVPESVTTSARVMSFPPLPELPPFLSGRDLVVIDGAVLEDDDRAAELLAPLRDLAPEMDTFGRIPAPDLLAVHMDPPAPSPAVSDHSVLTELPDEAIESLLDQVGPGTRSGLMFAELRHLGGAFGRPVPTGGALSHVAGEYLLFCVAIAPFAEAAVAGRAAAASVVNALGPWSGPSLVPTFTEGVRDTSAMFDGEDWARLCEVRAAVDPQRVFLANHRV